MKPHERRQKLLGWLRQHEAVTSDDAADHLGVSLRTLHRDIAALRLNGYPIHGEPGRGGGIRLDASSRPPAIEFDADEVIGLILTLRLAEAAQTLPISSPTRSALRRLEKTLAASQLDAVDRLLERVIIERPSEASDTASFDRRVLPAIEESFRRQKGLRFEYEDQTQTVESQFLIWRAPIWLLLGFDADADEFREFRLDRIARPRVLESVDFSIRNRPRNL